MIIIHSCSLKINWHTSPHGDRDGPCGVIHAKQHLRNCDSKRKWCTAVLHSLVLNLRDAVRVWTTALLHDSLWGETRYSMTAEWSVIPLILSAFTTLCVCERPRFDVGAQAALGEHADSAHISKNRLSETQRLELLQSRRREELGARAAAQTWFAGDVSIDENDIILLPYTKYGHGCEQKNRRLLQFRFPFVHIRSLPFKCSVSKGLYSLRSVLRHKTCWKHEEKQPFGFSYRFLQYS